MHAMWVRVGRGLGVGLVLQGTS